MNERLLNMRERARRGDHRALRQDPPDVLAACKARGYSPVRRNAVLTRMMCSAERVVIGPDERILFTRTLRSVPSVFDPKEWQALTAGRTLHELGPISNICADWAMALDQGLLGRRRAAEEAFDRYQADPEAVDFLEAAIETIDAVLDLAARYASVARQMGLEEQAAVLEWVPAHRPRGLHEALQALRLLHAAVWLSGHYHVGLGRFDQVIWPYLDADLRAQRLDTAGAEELLAEFFIALNKDSDLYPGVQQGDNGQTLTVGGLRRDGSDGHNVLTRMVLRVAREVALIDPKINLRITADTDLDMLESASELTRKGLGFPQYSNDDVVIPALIKHGYAPEDARDYTVAACWEFIIPGKGMEVVNIGAVSLPAAADSGIRRGLALGLGFEAIMAEVAADIERQVRARVDAYRALYFPPAPFYSVLMDGCLETGRDLSMGLRYNSFGLHGACATNAADALAAVRQLVYEVRRVAPAELLVALDADYVGHEELRQLMLERGPRVGTYEGGAAEELLSALFASLADACEAIGDNGRGGLIRPGTGTAMYYVWLARGNAGMREPVVGATADGRHAGDFFSANLAPSPGTQAAGPLTVLQAFSRIDYQRIYNGGPITLELSDSVFRDAEGVQKVALLVRSFARLGCQQLQINSLNGQRLLEARAHPELHRDLIVRVWGWSGYFSELAPEYQEHIIARHLYASAG